MPLVAARSPRTVQWDLAEVHLLHNEPPTPKADLAGLFELTRGFRRLYFASIVAMAVGIGLLFLVPAVTRDVIDGFLAKDGGGYSFRAPNWIAELAANVGLGASTLNALLIAGSIVILTTTAAGLFQYLKGRWAAKASEAIMRRLRNTLHGHLAGLPARFFDKSETGDLVQRCTSDVETVRVFLASQVVEIGRSILLVLCVTPVLFSMSTKLACVTLALLPVLVVYSIVFFGKLIHLFTEVDEAEGKLTTVLQENLTGIRVVRSFGRSAFEIEKFGAANALHRDKTYHLMKLLAGFWSFSDLVCMGQSAIVLFFGCWWTLTGDISLGTMVAFTMYSAYVIWPVRQMGRTLVEAGKARVALGRLREVLQTPPEDAEDADDELPGGAPEALRGAISVSGLSFTYGRPPKKERTERPASHNVLEGIDFELAEGQTLALLGPPGSGKSTLIQLLLRLYDYDSKVSEEGSESGTGSIKLDGHELATLPREFVRSSMAVVLQNPFLYARTIEHNLRVGRADATEDELVAATVDAAIHDSILGFDAGYGTMLGERGVTLSGGQKQRLAIARALLKEAPILVLDDALSAVDTETERLILRALKERRGKKTTILIAHRLSCVTHADKILVFDEGRITERGTHQELVAKGGAYARLWSIQNAYHRDIDAHQKEGATDTTEEAQA